MPPGQLDIRHDSSGDYLRVPIPAGYALSFTTATNSTMSGIKGAGRTLDTILSSAGRRLETVLNRIGEKRLGLGPNVAALQLISALHDLHILNSISNPQYCTINSFEFDVSTAEVTVLADRLIWACNGFCSQCETPYIPQLLSDPLPESILKSIKQLLSYLRASTPLPNIALAIVYIHILIDSHLTTASIFRQLRVSAILQDLVDALLPQYWAMVPKPDVIIAIQNTLICLEERMALLDEYPDNSRFITPDALGVHPLINSRSCRAADVVDSWSAGQIVTATMLTQVCLFYHQGTLIESFEPSFPGTSLGNLLSICQSPENSDSISQRVNIIYQHVVDAMITHIALNSKVLEGHGGQVHSVAFSPHGQRVASGGDDGSVRLWDLESERTVAILQGHHPVTSVLFSPGGTYIASSGGERQIAQVWDANTRQQTTFHLENTDYKHTRGHAVAFHPDGSEIVSGSNYSDNWLRLWDVNTGRQKASFGHFGHQREVSSIQFSPDGRYILSGSLDGFIRMWDINTGRLLTALTDHGIRVNSVAFSPDGNRIVSGADDNILMVWSVKDPQKAIKLRACRGHTHAIQSVAYSPNGEHIATGSFDKTIRLWHAQTFESLAILKGHREPVLSVAFSPDGKYLASGSKDKTIRLWDISFFTSA